MMKIIMVGVLVVASGLVGFTSGGYHEAKRNLKNQKPQVVQNVNIKDLKGDRAIISPDLSALINAEKEMVDLVVADSAFATSEKTVRKGFLRRIFKKKKV